MRQQRAFGVSITFWIQAYRAGGCSDSSSPWRMACDPADGPQEFPASLPHPWPEQRTRATHIESRITTEGNTLSLSSLSSSAWQFCGSTCLNSHHAMSDTLVHRSTARYSLTLYSLPQLTADWAAQTQGFTAMANTARPDGREKSVQMEVLFKR